MRRTQSVNTRNNFCQCDMPVLTGDLKKQHEAVVFHFSPPCSVWVVYGVSHVTTEPCQRCSWSFIDLVSSRFPVFQLLS